MAALAWRTLSEALLEDYGAPAAARHTSAPAPRSAEGQLLSDLRSFVQLVGKDAARPLLNDMVDRL